MSSDAFALHLMQRALARPASELHPSFRPRYEARLRKLAQRLIGAGL